MTEYRITTRNGKYRVEYRSTHTPEAKWTAGAGTYDNAVQAEAQIKRYEENEAEWTPIERTTA